MRRKNIYIGVFVGLTALGILAYLNRKALKGIVWDMTTEARINDLHPAMQDKVRMFINKAEKKGIKLRIPSEGGYRTFEKQEEIGKRGVRAAPPGLSYHNYGLAIDVYEIKDGKALFENPRWDEIGNIGKSLGFDWGGDFKTGSPDYPHFEMNFGYDEEELLALYNETGNIYPQIV